MRTKYHHLMPPSPTSPALTDIVTTHHSRPPLPIPTDVPVTTCTDTDSAVTTCTDTTALSPPAMTAPMLVVEATLPEAAVRGGPGLHLAAEDGVGGEVGRCVLHGVVAHRAAGELGLHLADAGAHCEVDLVHLHDEDEIAEGDEAEHNAEHHSRHVVSGRLPGTNGA